MKKSTEKKIEIVFIIFVLLFTVFYFYLAANTDFLGDDEFGYYHNAKMFSQGEMQTLDIYGYPITFPGLFVTSFTSLLFLLFGPSLTISKMVSAFFGILTLIMVYLIGRKINIFYGIVSSIIFLSIYLFTHFMLLAYMDVPITFFSTLILYILLKDDSPKKTILLGVVLGISYYIKSSALVITLFMFLYSLFRSLKENNFSYLKSIMFSIIISFLILSPFLIRNIILYRFPYYDVLNIFFKEYSLYTAGFPKWLEDQVSTISPVNLSLNMFLGTMGWPLFILSIFGFSWLVVYDKLEAKEKNILLQSIFFVGIFLLVFFATQITGFAALESRHMFLMFPSLALASGFFMLKLQEKNKWLIVVAIAISLLSLQQSIGTAMATAESQRFPDDHIQAINWIKQNTEPDDLIFTTYGGPLGYYGERFNIWAPSPCLGEKFPNMMTTTDGGYIKEALKECDVSHILIWRQTVAQDYIIPASNLWGIYTYNFMNLVLTDTENFLVVYSNENNAVLKILYDDEKQPILTNITEIPFT
jgi:4-amino-4-deoxy-L-arabinose transferase-like glycosyltransferase